MIIRLEVAGMSDVLTLLRQLKESIMGVREDVQAVVAQLSKAKDEIIAKLIELEQKITDGTITTEDLQPLKDVAQTLDDVVPDVPEPPVES